MAAFFAILFSARAVSGFAIEWAWWTELGQLDTYLSMLAYGTLPVVGASLLAFAVLWMVHARALKYAGTGLRRHRAYGFISSFVLLGLAALLAVATIDSWTVVRFFGSLQLDRSSEWLDPVYQQPLSYYLFSLPFLLSLRNFLFALLVLSGLVFWFTARVWQVLANAPRNGEAIVLDELFEFSGALESRFLRALGALALVGLAINAYLGRYQMLWTDHEFMVGMNWVDIHVRLPLAWLTVAVCLLAALAVASGKLRVALAVPVVFLLQAAVPSLVGAVYVRPNEIAIERPYIQQHLEATREAYRLSQNARSVEFDAGMESRFKVEEHQATLSNVRLWDWRAFHDTVTQIQTLRPYYTFPDTDVDRYRIDGRLRQVLLTPRELDISQLRDAQSRWVNPHFIYTHGFGMVMAEANEITADGQPVLFVQDAPAQVRSKSLQLTRPEIYYGEVVHEPVFVRSGQEEFSYPAGQDNVFSRYEGNGGIPVSNPLMRLAAAVYHADYNILLTSLITDETRMMIRRNVGQRVEALANFVAWDADPYLVLTESGRLVWTVDGYSTSNAHPYSKTLPLTRMGPVNYIRNAVKATVDAYTGETILYVFQPDDPVIQAYWKLFPNLFRPASEMPEDLRQHARYPETFFRIQAEIYRTYHMRDAQAFYNKEDAWDIARNVQGQTDSPQPLSPVYVVASLPGSDEPEFLLLLPFTPRNKDNLIGMMLARCDGENLGELVFLRLSKQELVFGPMQIEARINQDQNIAKDLSLWNQQGSRVLRGQILTLPIGDTVAYVEPIYIQASEARMPQLRKIVIAVGNDLIYRDTYREALQELAQLKGVGDFQTVPASDTMETGPGALVTRSDTGEPEPRSLNGTADSDARIRQEVRSRLRRYRQLVSEGKWADAGRELEALENMAGSP
ncbi:MAG: UPF0182 family protein [Bryobacterales bacterium]|jgi:uncharacterized membrane protein (UPF0182 family)|nr:UPF0182 family protein [Bryobacterales bacterium]